MLAKRGSFVFSLHRRSVEKIIDKPLKTKEADTMRRYGAPVDIRFSLLVIKDIAVLGKIAIKTATEKLTIKIKENAMQTVCRMLV